ncbi:cytochrome c-type biogenesis protein CcmH [Sneathiella sp. P13V-1]|nr:cytochrome c-type biogenesis protein [Sneathiella sp. P13V-1]MBE7636292.1 cytochrome c-type biogenesis protein CcmH [Sneathiella sp. P13V-1]
MGRIKHLVAILGVMAGLALSAPAFAIFVEERLPNAADEARAREIAEDIRCLVCQNQSIMDSNAGLAKDLRAIVREQVAAGKSDDEVREFLVVRYGDWVLLNPPLKTRTLILWASPFVLLVVGGFFMFRFLRRKNDRAETAAAPAPLTAEEQAELDKLLRNEDGGK